MYIYKISVENIYLVSYVEKGHKTSRGQTDNKPTVPFSKTIRGLVSLRQLWTYFQCQTRTVLMGLIPPAGHIRWWEIFNVSTLEIFILSSGQLMWM
jgi:hypothetical protein